MDLASDSGSRNARSARWSLRLFGGFELNLVPGKERVLLPGKRERVLLAYLALSADCRQPRRKLATLLWGDATDETALDNLRTCVWSLRRALGDTDHRIIASDREDVVLERGAFDVDVLSFRGLVARTGRNDLQAAANLYSGELLDGAGVENEEFESWRRVESMRCRDQIIDVLTRLMVQLAEGGEPERAIEAGTRILKLEPLNEAAVRRMMRLYAGSGRRVAAINLYRAIANALRTELNVEPEAETRLVFAEISSAGVEQPKGPAAPGAKHPTGPMAIAVLPFVNMSGDASQEFFSDGMTEEINSAIARIRNLNVIARTSAFQFKDKNQDVRAVGQALGASHVIEGSVRKSNQRVRVNARLCRTGDGVQLWSESYDRQLTDIFAIQEDIAQAIAAALRIPLGLEPSELVPNRTGDLETYQQYLLARALYRARGVGIAQAISTLEALVARDPGYPPAWALLARSYSLVMMYSPVVFSAPIEEARRVLQHYLNKMEMAAQRAIDLDPKHADVYQALAGVQTIKGNWAAAEDFFHQALVQKPNDPEILNYYSLNLAIVGKNRSALAVRERLQTLEPLVPVYNLVTAIVMWNTGQTDVPVSILEAMPADALGGFYRNCTLANAYARLGRFNEAADTLRLITGNQVSRQSVEDAERLLRMAPTKAKDPDALPILEGDLNFVYLHVGAIDRIMEFPERNLEIGYLGQVANLILWPPERAAMRKTERFKAYVRAIGLVDYWRARGWADGCRPVGADDFVCD